MFTTLPDFTPRDSHSLWYTSSRSPFNSTGPVDAHADSNSSNNGQNHSRQRGHIERSALARLAADEQYMARRRLNVQNYGSGWLKPPGVPKTLHQMREEKREQEEHQEAMRREQLAQELAEAEAGGMPEEGMMDDVQLDGAQDLDDEIPDAEEEFGLHDDEDDEEDDDEDGDEEDEEVEEGVSMVDEEALREERQNDLMVSRLRMNDDAFREALVRGEPDGDDIYGGEEEIEEEEQGHMLDEDDFLQDGIDDGLAMDMDADLDEDVPEAESGDYEHTDSEAGMSSSVDDDDDSDDEEDAADISFAPRTAPLGPPLSPTLQGRSSLPGGRVSMDLSNLLSQDGSSFLESNPAAGRRTRHG